jgi:hypothetical protein
LSNKFWLSHILIHFTQDEAIRRSATTLAKSISSLQQLEKEKLLLVAAKHLDLMQSHVPSLQAAMGGECNVQKKYLAKKILDVESLVNEEIDNIQAFKIDIFQELP